MFCKIPTLRYCTSHCLYKTYIVVGRYAKKGMKGKKIRGQRGKYSKIIIARKGRKEQRGKDGKVRTARKGKKG